MIRPFLLSALVLVIACGEPEILPATAYVPPEQTFAGRTSNAELFAAVITNAEGVEAYFCDGTRDFWFRGTVSATSGEFTEAFGAKLLLSFEAERVTGRLEEGEDKVTTFELPTVTGEVLFRAETGVGTEPVLGGWIRLPDGEQRGVVRVGTISFVSTITHFTASCEVCPSLALMPAALTPATATLRPNTPQTFTVIALGDSMMSGEGAPVTEGAHTNSGTAGVPESWSNGLPFSRRPLFLSPPFTGLGAAADARRCHRGAAGAGIAVRELQTAWPRIELVHQNFACSGAQTTTMVNSTLPGGFFYSGPGGCGELRPAEVSACRAKTDDLGPVPSQLTSMTNFLGLNTLAADAVLLSIGVNDLGFSKIIADCVTPFSHCNANNSASRTIFREGRAALPARYTALANAFTGASVSPSNIYISKYPNPLRRTSNALCGGSDFSDTLLSGLDDAEATFANGIQGQINDLVAAGAAGAGWNLVEGHIGTEAGHGICAGNDAWFNDTKTALVTQGADLVSPFPGIELSAGMVHPNKTGQRDMYAPAWKSTLEATLRKRFTPKTPTGLRVVKFESVDANNIRVTLQWNDVNVFETLSEVQGEGLGSVSVIGVTADVTTAQVLVRKSSPRASVVVRACFEGSVRLCSPDSRPVEFEAVVPQDAPSMVMAFPSFTNRNEFTLSWADGGPRKQFTTLEIDRRGVVTSLAIEGTRHALPQSDSITRFRVATCNTLGCGPGSTYVDVRRNPPPLQTCVPPNCP